MTLSGEPRSAFQSRCPSELTASRFDGATLMRVRPAASTANLPSELPLDSYRRITSPSRDRSSSVERPSSTSQPASASAMRSLKTAWGTKVHSVSPRSLTPDSSPEPRLKRSPPSGSPAALRMRTGSGESRHKIRPSGATPQVFRGASFRSQPTSIPDDDAASNPPTSVFLHRTLNEEGALATPDVTGRSPVESRLMKVATTKPRATPARRLIAPPRPIRPRAASPSALSRDGNESTLRARATREPACLASSSKGCGGERTIKTGR